MMTGTRFIYNDGGRARAGYRGHTSDCVCRSIAIASGRPYAEIYEALNYHAKRCRGKDKSSARLGVVTSRKWFKDYMQSLGFKWTPTMRIGSGCKVHLLADELPNGRIVIALSRHYTAMVDGIIHDTHDPRREMHCVRPDDGLPLKRGEWRNSNGICSISRRCVYGYWALED